MRISEYLIINIRQALPWKNTQELIEAIDGKLLGIGIYVEIILEFIFDVIEAHH